MNINHDITIVISNYNYGRYVSSAVDSCLSQTVSCNIVVVDDCSTDNSVQVLKNYKNEPRVTVVRLKSNSGGNARGKNVGIALSKTPFIALLDSDDMYVPDAMQKLCDSQFDFIHGYTIRVRSDENYSSLLEVCDRPFVNSGRHEKLKNRNDVAPQQWAFGIAGNTVLAKRDLYIKFGLYDEEMKWKVHREMMWRWLSNEVKMKTVNEHVSLYRKHPSSVTHLSSKGKGPKSQKLVDSLFKNRLILRKVITEDNTPMLHNYDAESHIGEIF